MLQFYVNPKAKLTARPPFSRPLTIRSSAGISHDAVPLSHIYLTSPHYAGLLKQSLGDKASNLRLLPARDVEQLSALPGFPRSFRNLGFENIAQLHAEIKQHSQDKWRPKFVLLNGIGTGLGDNYVGIGVLQRLIKLLAPMRPTFCMMQELEERIEPLYRHEPCVRVQTCFMPLSEFMEFDFIIDFSSIKDMPSFDEVAAAHFNSYAFSVNKLIPNTDIQPRLNVDKTKTEKLREHINRHLPANRKTVLLHPLASSNLRKLPSAKAVEIIKALGANGYNVVSAFEHANPPTHFLCLAEQSKTINDLVHIIDAVDAVISVGTVVYHIASALGKPTVVLPTVNADIRSANLMPEVLAWTPSASQHLYLNLHKSEKPEDLAVAEQIWSNLDSRQLVSSLDKHINAFTANASGKLTPANARPRVAVVIPYAPQSALLAGCIDSLCKVQGFDPQHLITVEDPGLGRTHHHYTNAFNQGIKQALQLGCDFVWLLHENARLPADYLNQLLKHFEHSDKVGIVGGAESGIQTLYGDASLKPDYLTLGQQPQTGLRQPWINFSSCLIKANVFNDIPLLASSMQRLFCDIDYCVQAARYGWQTWHDPTAQVDFIAAPQLTTKPPVEELTRSARQFYNKWGTHFKVSKPTQIEDALLGYIDF